MPANHVCAELRCSKCGCTQLAEIETDIDGRGFAKDYRIGEEIDWLPGQAPPDGAVTTDGYVVCGRCGLDYFVKVVVLGGRLQEVKVAPARKGYIL